MTDPQIFLRVNRVAPELCAQAREVTVADLHENTGHLAYAGLMSPRTRAVIDTLAYTVILPLLLWLTWMLLQYLITGYTRGERSGQSSLNLVVWPFRLVFTVSFGMLALQVFVALLKSIRQVAAPGAAR